METNKDHLNTFYNDITMFVVYNFFEMCVLKNHLCSLNVFLNSHVHKLFHLCYPAVLCCQCAKSGNFSDSKEKRKLEECEFERLFKRDEISTPDHEEKSGQQNMEHCVCLYSADPTCDICDLDITIIYKIITTCFTFPPIAGNPRWVKEIRDTRNKLFHCGDTVSQDLFVQLLGILENATCNLASVISKMYHRQTIKRIGEIKSKYNFKEDIADTIRMCNADIENKLSKVLNKMDYTVGGNLQFHVGMSGFNPPHGSTNEMTDMLQGESQGEKKCLVVWTFKTQGNWNVKEVAEKLKQVSALLDFKIEFIYAGSLVVTTSINMSLLTNADEFYNAVGPFLEQFASKCNLDDTSVEMEIDVSIVIYYLPMKDRDDYKVACIVCTEKDEVLRKRDDEIYRLKQEINKQLKRSYSSLMIELGSLSRSLSKELFIDDPLDHLIASFEDKIAREKSGDFSTDDENLADVNDQNRENSSENGESHETKPMVAGEKSLEDKDASNESGPTEDSKAEIDVKLDSGKNEGKVYKSTQLNVSANVREQLMINSLEVTKNDQLIVTYTGSKRVSMFSNTGAFLDECYLLGNIWDVCVCPMDIETSEGSDVSGVDVIDVVFTLPDLRSYQYISIEENTIFLKKCVFVGIYCLGINATEDVVLIGGEDAYHVFSRSDEYLRTITAHCSITRIALKSFQPYWYESSTRYLDEDSNSSDGFHVGDSADEDSITSEDISIGKPCDEASTTMSHVLLLSNNNEIHEESIQLLSKHWYKGRRFHHVSSCCFKVNNSEQQRDLIHDITVDKTNNETLILSNSGNCIYSLHSDRTIENILNKQDGIEEPTAFCFDEKNRRLFIANKNGREIRMFVKQK